MRVVTKKAEKSGNNLKRMYEKAKKGMHLHHGLGTVLKGNYHFHGGLVPGFAAEEMDDTRAEWERPGMWGLLLGKDEMENSISTLRSAITEFNATAIWQFFHIGIARVTDLYAPEYRALAAGGGHFLLVVLLVISFSAPSGGHMNPNITLATVLIGHTTVFRYIVYTIAQLLGAILGSILMRMTLGWDGIGAADLKGCAHPDGVGAYSMLTINVVVFHMLLCVIGGVAFDPAQAKVFGPILAPILIAAAIFLIIFATSNTIPGYGPGLNWAECFSKSIATGEILGGEWYSIVAPTIASCVHSILFVLVPPTHSDTGMFRLPLLEPLRRAEAKMRKEAAAETDSEYTVNPVADEARDSRGSLDH